MESPKTTASPRLSATTFHALNIALSLVALGAIAWLLIFRNVGDASALRLNFLPPVNATLNGIAACLLIAGRLAIRRHQRDLHRKLMIAAFAASALFLVGYLTYHFTHGDTHFGGEGLVRLAYFALLISHVLLSMTILPMAGAAFYFAWRKDFRAHTRVTKILHPIWLWVSLSGVAVFLMLRPYYPGT